RSGVRGFLFSVIAIIPAKYFAIISKCKKNKKPLIPDRERSEQPDCLTPFLRKERLFRINLYLKIHSFLLAISCILQKK
ncbi:MAG: hypothetical protein AB8F94_01710, partial [Saprospiraceae bacterium]